MRARLIKLTKRIPLRTQFYADSYPDSYPVPTVRAWRCLGKRERTRDWLLTHVNKSLGNVDLWHVTQLADVILTIIVAISFIRAVLCRCLPSRPMRAWALSLWGELSFFESVHSQWQKIKASKLSSRTYGSYCIIMTHVLNLESNSANVDHKNILCTWSRCDTRHCRPFVYMC